MKAIVIFLIAIFYNSMAIAENICDSPLSYEVGTDEECIKECPNREVNYEGSGSAYLVRNCALKKCPSDKPLRTNFGNCFSCDEPKLPIGDDVENCSVCPNRVEVKRYGTICPLKKCPSDASLRAWLDRCHACDDKDDYAEVAKNCDVCPNRIKAKNKFGQERCKLPPEQPDPNAVMAKDGKCPPDKPLMRWDGRCFPCDAIEDIAIDSKCNDKWGICESVCPNREIVYGMGGNPPSILKCPTDKPLRDGLGRCQACDYEWDINMQFQDPKKCENICPNRFQIGGYLCIPKTSKRYKASFECGDISKLKRNERAICYSENLGELDIQMAALYNKIMEKFKDNSGKAAEIKTSQRAWLKKATDPSNSGSFKMYQDRIEELEKM